VLSGWVEEHGQEANCAYCGTEGTCCAGLRGIPLARIGAVKVETPETFAYLYDDGRVLINEYDNEDDDLHMGHRTSDEKKPKDSVGMRSSAFQTTVGPPEQIAVSDLRRLGGLTQFSADLRLQLSNSLNSNVIELMRKRAPACGIITLRPLANY
jgi:hypothetical protein